MVLEERLVGLRAGIGRWEEHRPPGVSGENRKCATDASAAHVIFRFAAAWSLGCRSAAAAPEEEQRAEAAGKQCHAGLWNGSEEIEGKAAHIAIDVKTAHGLIILHGKHDVRVCGYGGAVEGVCERRQVPFPLEPGQATQVE